MVQGSACGIDADMRRMYRTNQRVQLVKWEMENKVPFKI